MPTNPVGRNVLLRAREGDERAFEVLVNAYGSLVLGLAWRFVRDRQEAEDLSQEVFLRVYRFLDRYDPDRPFEPWLRKVAMNLLLNLTAGKAARVFTTTMGHAHDFKSEGFRRLLVNACYWCVGMEAKIPARAKVDCVGTYDPPPIGMRRHRKGLKPADHKL